MASVPPLTRTDLLILDRLSDGKEHTRTELHSLLARPDPDPSSPESLAAVRNAISRLRKHIRPRNKDVIGTIVQGKETTYRLVRYADDEE